MGEAGWGGEVHLDRQEHPTLGSGSRQNDGGQPGVGGHPPAMWSRRVTVIDREPGFVGRRLPADRPCFERRRPARHETHLAVTKSGARESQPLDEDQNDAPMFVNG